MDVSDDNLRKQEYKYLTTARENYGGIQVCEFYSRDCF